MRFMLAALLLLAPDEIDARIREFTDAIKASKSDGDRVGAIQAFAKTRHTKVALKLAQFSGGPFSVEVRIAAADACGRLGDPKAGPMLQNVFSTFQRLFASENPKDKGDQQVAEAVARAIGSCRDVTSTPKLLSVITGNNIPLIAECVRTLGKTRDPGCLDQLMRLHYAATSPEMPGVSNPRKPLKDDTLAALRRITGQSLTTAGEFQNWFKGAKGSGWRPLPEESLGGFPFEAASWAVFTGKGEIAALAQYDLVLLNPDAFQKAEIAPLRAIALTGDVQAALDKGFLGAVVKPEEAAAMRKKFPRALLVARGGGSKVAPFVNAVLAEELDPKKADAAEVKELKDAKLKNDTVTLALFVAEKREEGEAAVKFARAQAFLPYVAPDKEFSRLAAAGP